MSGMEKPKKVRRMRRRAEQRTKAIVRRTEPKPIEKVSYSTSNDSAIMLLCSGVPVEEVCRLTGLSITTVCSIKRNPTVKASEKARAASPLLALVHASLLAIKSVQDEQLRQLSQLILARNSLPIYAFVGARVDSVMDAERCEIEDRINKVASLYMETVQTATNYLSRIPINEIARATMMGVPGNGGGAGRGTHPHTSTLSNLGTSLSESEMLSEIKAMALSQLDAVNKFEKVRKAKDITRIVEAEVMDEGGPIQ